MPKIFVPPPYLDDLCPTPIPKRSSPIGRTGNVTGILQITICSAKGAERKMMTNLKGIVRKLSKEAKFEKEDIKCSVSEISSKDSKTKSN